MAKPAGEDIQDRNLEPVFLPGLREDRCLLLGEFPKEVLPPFVNRNS